MTEPVNAPKRLLDWEKRLAQHFESSRRRLFAWGSFDCALAVCVGIHAITGVDPGAAFRETYHTKEEAIKLLGSEGLGNFVASIAAQYNFRELRPTFAGRGDIALVDNGDPGQALGTVDLSGRYAWCVSDQGFVRVPMGRWLRAWKIG